MSARMDRILPNLLHFRTTLILSFVIYTGEGYKFFQTKIPNGENVAHPCKSNYIWKGVGHTNEDGGGKRNQFGLDFLAAGKTWTTELCRKDSDQDGKSNGQELGDPKCTWQEGQVPEIVTGITHPGVCDPIDSPMCKGRSDWVSCDLETFKCDAIKDPTVKNFTLRFPETVVPGTETNYFCMTFDVPTDDSYHIIASKPFIDNAYVLHHILVYGCKDSADISVNASACDMGQPTCPNLIGAWAVGYSGDCLHSDIGIQFGKVGYKKVLLQFHWNNPELRKDYTDSSGMTFYYTNKLRKYNAELIMVGQQYIEIPPNRERVEVTATCRSQHSKVVFNDNVKVVRGLNHMHYLGREQKIELFRDGKKVTDLTNESSYSYDSPVINDYENPIEIRPGDEIKTTCIFKSTTRHNTVFYGMGTSDEMCFGFLLLYPKENANKTHCVNWRSIPTFDLFNTDVIYGCKVQEFFNTSIPETAALRNLLSENCRGLGQCLQECKEAVKIVRNHKCLQNDVEHYIRELALKYDPYTVQFFSLLDSCNIDVAMETCKSPDVDVTLSGDGTSNSPNNGPNLVSMVMVMGLVLALNLFSN